MKDTFLASHPTAELIDLRGRRLDELPDLLTIQELAIWTSIPVKTIYDWNSRNVGPVPIKIGKHLRYPRAAVQDWISKRTRREWSSVA